LIILFIFFTFIRAGVIVRKKKIPC